MQECSLFSTPFPAFTVCKLFDEGHSDLCEVMSYCSFDLHLSFFFLKTVLAIRGLLYFHMNCEIFCFSSVKNAIGNLIGITLNL